MRLGLEYLAGLKLSGGRHRRTAAGPKKGLRGTLWRKKKEKESGIGYIHRLLRQHGRFIEELHGGPLRLGPADFANATGNLPRLGDQRCLHRVRWRNKVNVSNAYFTLSQAPKSRPLRPRKKGRVCKPERRDGNHCVHARLSSSEAQSAILGVDKVDSPHMLKLGRMGKKGKKNLRAQKYEPFRGSALVGPKRGHLNKKPYMERVSAMRAVNVCANHFPD
jgi:hypothetical protein